MNVAAPTDIVQPDSFEFSAENLAQAKKIIARYPEGRQASAIMPLLDMAQRQSGWLPRAAIICVADMIEVAHIRAYEVATFYSMYNLAPVGEHLVQVCTTTPCWLRGSADIVSACEKHLGIKIGETTPDGKVTLREVECLGACVNAPMMQVGDDYYEDLDPANTVKILEEVQAGRRPNPGPQTGRQTSAPAPGPTTLKEPAADSTKGTD
jgi:NADH-quinone oxidoreductase subunit E